MMNEKAMKEAEKLVRLAAKSMALAEIQNRKDYCAYKANYEASLEMAVRILESLEHFPKKEAESHLKFVATKAINAVYKKWTESLVDLAMENR